MAKDSAGFGDYLPHDRIAQIQLLQLRLPICRIESGIRLNHFQPGDCASPGSPYYPGFRPAEYVKPASCSDLPDRLVQRAGVFKDDVKRGIEQGGEGLLLCLVAIDSQVEEGTPVGGDETAVVRKDGNPHVERADEFGPDMKMEHHLLIEPGREHLVFDLLRGDAHQCQGVMLLSTAVTGDIEDADNSAVRIGDR